MRWDPDPGQLSDILPVSGIAPAGSVLLFARASWVLAWSFLDTDGANPASAALSTGEQAGGTGLAAVNLPAGGSANLCYGLPGLPADAGLTLTVTGAAVQYSIILGVPK